MSPMASMWACLQVVPLCRLAGTPRCRQKAFLVTTRYGQQNTAMEGSMRQKKRNIQRKTSQTTNQCPSRSTKIAPLVVLEGMVPLTSLYEGVIEVDFD